jgi:exopolysaccharide biosynthesis WecB/TagA/CpsF family protein
METLDFLGLTFDNLDTMAVVNTLLRRQRGARFAYMVTPNADHLARLKRQPNLRQVYEQAWLCVLDSRLLGRLAARLGLAAPHVATGADITAQLLNALEPQRVAIIGLDAKYLPALRARYRHLYFVHHAPPPNLLNDQLAFRRARDFAVSTNAAYTFIAVGSPVQELLAYAISLQPGSTGTGLCIGAALEYCAGAATRAPAWMQHAGLEWLHRLARDPARLARRYLVDDPPVLAALGQAFVSQTWRRLPPRPRPQSAPAATPGRGPYPPLRPVPLQKIPDAG